MHSGFVKLLDRYGGIIQHRKYKTRTERIFIIEDWQDLYADGFKKCILIVEPDTSDNINEDGTNKWGKPMQSIEPEKEPEPEVVGRPPAVYSNIPVYDYFQKRNGHGT